MLLFSSFFTCTGTDAFLKEGSFALGFGAEKKDESALASLTACEGALVVVIDVNPGSFFTPTVGFVDDAVPTAAFFNACGGLLDTGSASFRFFPLGSKNVQQAN